MWPKGQWPVHVSGPRLSGEGPFSSRFEPCIPRLPDSHMAITYYNRVFSIVHMREGTKTERLKIAALKENVMKSHGLNKKRVKVCSFSKHKGSNGPPRHV